MTGREMIDFLQTLDDEELEADVEIKLDYVETKVISRVKKTDGISVQTQRSMIHPQYANRFIRRYLID